MDERQIKELQEKVERSKSRAHIHTPYSETSSKSPDFEVEYEIDMDPELKGIVPRQGMRCDFLYDGDIPSIDGIYMIWPELLDDAGNVICDKNTVPSNKGKATMWILLQEGREDVHRKRIRLGATGYWVIGSKKFAKVRVTKILGLFTNK